MHLLYYGKAQTRLLHNERVEDVLKRLSIRVCIAVLTLCMKYLV